MIIAIVGKIGSGKTTAAKYLQQEFGFEVIKFSGFVRDILDRMHLEQTRENMSDLSTSLRKRFGKDIFSYVVNQDIKNKEKVIVEGVRVPEDLKRLKNREDFTLLAIDVDTETRFKRLKDRSENCDDQTKTYEEFLEDHERKTETQIGEIMKDADVFIKNDRNLKEFYRKLDELVTDLNGN